MHWSLKIKQEYYLFAHTFLPIAHDTIANENKVTVYSYVVKLYSNYAIINNLNYHRILENKLQMLFFHNNSLMFCCTELCWKTERRRCLPGRCSAPAVE